MTATTKKTISTQARPKTKRRPPATASRAAGASAATRATPARDRTVPTKPRRNRARTPEEFKTSTLNIRVKEDLKAQATETLAKAGISLAEAVRVFLGRVVSDQSFPFPLHLPNAETAAALRDSIAQDRKRFSRIEEMFDDLEKGGVR